MEEEKKRVFSIIQKFLKIPPVVIWGSGATVPFGFPSMGRLNEIIKVKMPEFDQDCDNLEVELGKEKYNELMPLIREIIWDEITNVDKLVLDRLIKTNASEFLGLRDLVIKILDTHPKVLNLITTNYDRVIENTLSFHNILFTDGFLGKDLSLFNEELFSNKNIVNLIKVHGSLNWFEIDGEIRYLQNKIDTTLPQIICPGKNKYQEAYKSPYRELIQKSDAAINNANSFLVIGFGFNDEHLTPKIKSKIKKGVPIVVIAKNITPTCFLEVEGAEKYVLIEENDTTSTKITFKDRSTEKETIILEGNFWSLNNFVEIL